MSWASVPIAAINEHTNLGGAKYYVGLTTNGVNWFSVQAITQSKPKQMLAEQEFGRGISATDVRHRLPDER